MINYALIPIAAIYLYVDVEVIRIKLFLRKRRANEQIRND
jgi:hypothetical protein